MDKAEVLAALGAQVADELASLERLAAMSVDEATSAESRAENQYDTRATEASYLAAGQGRRLVEARRFAGLLASAVPAAFVLYALRGASGVRWLLLAPDGGGRRVAVSGDDVLVVTRASPVGEALADREAGELVRIGPEGAGAPHEVIGVW